MHSVATVTSTLPGKMAVLILCLLLNASAMAEMLSVSTIKEFQDGVRHAEREDVVVIQSASLKFKDAVSIDRAISVVGAPTVISCSSKSQSALIVRSPGVNLTDLVFERCSNSALRIISSTEAAEKPTTAAKEVATTTDVLDGKARTEVVTLTNVAFRNNKATVRFSRGGGLSILRCRRCKNALTTVVLQSCFFEGNGAELGGAIYAEAADLTILDTRFLRNDAAFLGGGVHVRGHLSQLAVERTTFQDNRVVSTGRSRETTLRDGRPIEPLRYFKFPLGGSHGGAIDARNVKALSVSGTAFLGNRAPAGGAVSVELHWTVTNIEIALTDCRFDNNTAELRGRGSNEDTQLGGGVYLVSAARDVDWTVDRCTFKNNAATHGGALHVAALLCARTRIEDSVFEGNSAVGLGGALLVRNTAVTVKSSIFRDNTAGIGGGVLVTNNGMLKAVGLAGLPPDVRVGKAVEFLRNRAKNGGGLGCVACGDVVLQDSKFRENAATSQGGGVYVFDSAGSFQSTQCLFEGNVAEEGGGVAIEAAEDVGFSSADASFKTVFRKNKASSGSAVQYIGNRLKRNRLALTHAEVVQNEGRSVGSRSGGTVRLVLNAMPPGAAGEILLKDVSIASNKATFAGGLEVLVDGVWNDNDRGICPPVLLPESPCRLLRFVGVSIKNNRATSAPGIFVSDPRAIDVSCERSRKTRSTSLQDRLRSDEPEAALKNVCLLIDNNLNTETGMEENITTSVP